MFDVYGNHVAKDVEVKLNTDGFYILDQIGSSRKVRFYFAMLVYPFL